MFSIIIRIVKQIKNDKRSLALVLVAPLLLISFIYLVFGSKDYQAKLATYNLNPVLLTFLATTNLDFIETDLNSVDEILQKTDADAVIYMQENDKNIRIKFVEPNSTKVNSVLKELKELKELQSLGASQNVSNNLANNNLNLTIEFLYGSQEASIFENLGYMFLAVFAFFFVFLLSGISFIRERTLGTMERFMLTPIVRWQVVAGYILGFGIFATIQSLLLILYSHFVLDLPIAGSMLTAICITILLAFVAVAIGSAVSVLANNEFQVIQFVPIIIVPQVFYAGLVPIETFPYHLDWLSLIMPIYYASEALHKVLVYGLGWADIWQEALILVGFLVFFFLLNTILLKKYRRI